MPIQRWILRCRRYRIHMFAYFLWFVCYTS